MKKILKILGAAIAALLVLIALVLIGPLFTLNPEELASYPLKTPTDEKLIIPGAEELTVDRTHGQGKTDLSFVYIHGFSASRQEITPVVEDLSETFSASEYFVRLSGHGMTLPNGDGMKDVTAFDWLRDADHAIEMGQKLGKRTVLMAMSFGAALAVYETIKNPDKIAALILLSPAFGVADPRAPYASGPFGTIVARLVVGSYREFHAKNEEQKKFWTTRYPTTIIPPFISVLSYVGKQDFSRIKVPTLIFYTSHDETISIPTLKQHFAEIANPNKQLLDVPGATGHVITGRIMEPGTVQYIEEHSAKFIKGL